MRGYEPDDGVMASYAKLEGALARLVRLSLCALGDGQANLAWRRELRDSLSRVGGEIARFYSGFAIPAPDAGQARFDEANRRQRTFLDVLATAISEALSLGGRHFPACDASGSGETPVEALGRITTDTAPSQDTINALALLFSRAREIRAFRAESDRERERALEREFMAVKLKTFLEATRWLEVDRPELLFKAATKLERACSAEGARVEPGPVADLPDRVVVAWKDGAGEHARYSESGVAIALDFAGRECAISGHVETIEGRVGFAVRDPAGGGEGGGEAFLAKLGLVKAVAALRAAMAARKAAPTGKADLAESVGQALDDIL